MSRKFDGVAFDLDGTLYPNYRFYTRLIPFIAKEHRLLLAFGKARNILRAGTYKPQAAETTFYDTQARIMGELLNANQAAVKAKTERLIYRGWEPVFKQIALYPEVRETLEALRKDGIRLGVLSDFPPEIKLDNLHLQGYWDTLLCSEEAGALKPDPAPFRELLKQMAIPPDRLLYVGNSVRYDIIGAKKMGMKAALILPGIKKYRLFLHRTGNADFVFAHYRELRDYVLH